MGAFTNFKSTLFFILKQSFTNGWKQVTFNPYGRIFVTSSLLKRIIYFLEGKYAKYITDLSHDMIKVFYSDTTPFVIFILLCDVFKSRWKNKLNSFQKKKIFTNYKGLRTGVLAYLVLGLGLPWWHLFSKFGFLNSKI